MPPEPSCPLPPAPKLKARPFSEMLRLWRFPAATSTQRETRIAFTCSGRNRGFRSPRPSWPCSLQPQDQRSPVAVLAKLWAPPQETCTTGRLERVGTGFGVAVLTKSPTPSWPCLFSPKARTFPERHSAMQCDSPADKCRSCSSKAEENFTRSLSSRSAPPIPSCPRSPRPTPIKRPSSFAARTVKPFPAAVLSTGMCSMESILKGLARFPALPSCPESLSPEVYTKPS